MKEFVTIINNKVDSIRQGTTIVEGEIENTNNLKSGMELIDGVWKFPIVIPPIPQPTIQEINDNLMTIMNGLTDIYMATLGL